MGLVRWLRWFFWLEPDPIGPGAATRVAPSAPPLDPEQMLLIALTRRMAYLAADAGADERERILAAAPSALHGLMLEEAGHHAARLLRAAGGELPPPNARAAEAAQRALEAECFQAAQTGYVLCIVARGLAAAAGGQVPVSTAAGGTAAGSAVANAACAPRVYGRARRLRLSLDRPVRRWVRAWSGGAVARVVARGWRPPARVAAALVQATEALVAFGYAAAREAAVTRAAGSESFAHGWDPGL